MVFLLYVLDLLSNRDDNDGDDEYEYEDIYVMRRK